jgi:two-component system LytT family sensor kinase
MNNSDLKKVEFWIATGLYILFLLILISGVDGNQYNYRVWEYGFEFKRANIKFSYFNHFFIPRLCSVSLLYFTFLFLNFYLFPTIYKKINIVYNAIFLVALFLTLGLLNSVILTYSKAYVLVSYDDIDQAYAYLFLKGYTNTVTLFATLGLYVAVKIYLPIIFKHLGVKYKNAGILQECTVAGIIWVFVLILLATQTSKDDYAILWFFLVPIGILQYGFALSRQIPDLKEEGVGLGGFLWRSILLIALAGFAFGIFGVLIYQRDEFFMIPLLGNVALHGFITTPLCWVIYNYRSKNKSEISFLKKQLGKSDASLSFLQSQINPHFLFNALNTLYGTALQENAERTGEGIQKLGDMMRFMLHENVQDKISLTRDIDYLENYIALQKLRTSKSADIVIDTQIDEQLNNYQITPMLLIPFVENAFKHGISLQHPSHIKVTLQTKGNKLYFDVHNSIYIKSDNDPEKLKSGIGLENVKQRLSLLYPGKHELIIRESAKEFFIHLTLEL